MGYFKLIFRGLVYYRRTNLGVLLGAALGTAILVGALVVGDSVKYSLKQLAIKRLGQTDLAIFSADRFFTRSLAEDLDATAKFTATPILRLNGMVSQPGNGGQLNSIQVVGVTPGFWDFAPQPVKKTIDVGAAQVAINRQLAESLDVEVGDTILLKVQKPSLIPGDLALTAKAASVVGIRVQVQHILDAAQFGSFSLDTTQIIPPTAFIDHELLSKELNIADRANVMLVKVAGNDLEAPAATLNNALKEHLHLHDAGLRLVDLPESNQIELRSSRIFIAPEVANAAFAVDQSAKGVLTYFVNAFRSADRLTPYSFVSAPPPAAMKMDLAKDEILITDWLAADLGVEPGDQIDVDYYLPSEGQGLSEKTAEFQVAGIIPLDPQQQRRVPAIPGLTDTENCRDWDPGIPIELDRIRPEDEQYWDKYKSTPKAFFNLETAQRLWGNRFGEFTGIQFADVDRNALQEKLLAELHPASLGFVIQQVRTQQIQASQKSVDFGQLFIGLSFFIIVAALLITSLLFVFGIQQRSEEAGTLRAVGFLPRQVRRLFLGEGLCLAVAGALLGVAGGLLYNKIILYALATVWQSAVRTTAFQLQIRLVTVAGGAVLGIAAAYLAMWIPARKQGRLTIRELQQSDVMPGRAKKLPLPRISSFLALVTAAMTIGILVITDAGRGKTAAAAFFSAGSLALVSGLCACYAIFVQVERRMNPNQIGFIAIALKNATRRRARSVTTIALLAAGVFLVVAVAANRQGRVTDPEKFNSGTGGFALFAKTALPVYRDLNTPTGQKEYMLGDVDLEQVDFVQMRLREGDPASCLNLNQVHNPNIVGVAPEALAERKRFTFSKIRSDVDPDTPWKALDKDLGDNVIPAVADENVIVWSLGKSVGDVITISAANGESVKLKFVGGIANSILQGYVLISERNFNKFFSSVSGSRVFLIDAPFERSEELARILRRRLQDVGITVATTPERLAQFNSVQNTYLSIFMLLGGLGVIIGSVGLGIVVMRNVLERRAELGLLRAVGFTKRQVQGLIIIEHWIIAVLGLVLGIISALIAVLPALRAPNMQVPLVPLALILAIILVSGLLWSALAGWWAVRGPLIPALRNE